MGVSTSLRDDLRAAAKLHADRPAVIDGDVTLSYTELDDAAEAVALALRDLGVRDGDCVVWHGRKSSAGVATVHGILRSGGGYVPLDPDGPIARADLITRACAPRAVVADGAARAQWDALTPGLDWSPLPAPPGADDGLWAHLREGDPRPPVDDLAYVLHTSGSTGIPKGVVHTHASASAFVDWAVAELDLTPDDVIVNSAPLHFDPTTLHLFAAVRSGAAVALMPAAAAPFPAAYIDFCRRSGGTVLYAVTSTLVWLVRHGTSLLPRLSGLRAFVTGGEILHPVDVNTLHDALPAMRLLNVYGPTESNVCTFHEIQPPLGPEDEVLIGRVLSGAEILVVDDDLTAVAPGEPGQLLVRGAMLMTGYLDAAQTARSMVRTADGREWYASGDQVCENPDGDLRFIGRVDAQIKSRGYRVELGEVEKAVRRCAGVHEAVAVATPDPVFSNLITVFVTAETEAARTLGGRLPEYLPPYMLPRHVVHVDGELPRLSNGKVDRKWLSDLASSPRLPIMSGFTIFG
ncbi:amino acid adenylation domain-containing protein (plasmid) [Streptomyces sp. NBC_00984]|uniref:amino acid adenylation domain-containing protein n=1 Tax=Streptomyces sp. NBC_00984 TaxID=2903700 RepID=UPI002F911D43|nr:amino acid adenylation domain-containing protein [Streptomyces sp. NBC_00984]